MEWNAHWDTLSHDVSVITCARCMRKITCEVYLSTSLPALGGHFRRLARDTLKSVNKLTQTLFQFISTTCYPTINLSTTHPILTMATQGLQLALPAWGRPQLSCRSHSLPIFTAKFFCGCYFTGRPCPCAGQFFLKKKTVLWWFLRATSMANCRTCLHQDFLSSRCPNAPCRPCCVFVRTLVVYHLHLCDNCPRRLQSKLPLRMGFLDRWHLFGTSAPVISLCCPIVMEMIHIDFFVLAFLTCCLRFRSGYGHTAMFPSTAVAIRKAVATHQSQGEGAKQRFELAETDWKLMQTSWQTNIAKDVANR